MSEAAKRELHSWGEGLVNVSRDGLARCNLLLRLQSVSLRGPETTVSLAFERDSFWWVDQVSHADIAPHEVVLHDVHGQQTRINRLVLPAGLERALHIGQFATRELELPTIATPFERSPNPPRSRKQPRSVIVWTEFATRSRLALWWACASFPSAPLWVVPFPRDWPGMEEVGCIRPTRNLMAVAPNIQRLSSKQVADFSSNWRRWLQGEARFRRVALPGWPEPTQWLGDVPQPIFDLFPTLTSGGLQLGPYDTQTLQLLDTAQWRSTIGAFRQLFSRHDDRLMQVWGDRTLHSRLHAWSRWKRGRYVESRPSQSEQSFSGLEYRLTEEGHRLLTRLPSLDVAPPFAFGAFRFYTPGSWVMTARGPRRAPARCFSS